MTVAIPVNMDALGYEFVVVVAKTKVYFCSRALQVPFLILRSSDISLIYLVLRGSRPKRSSLGGNRFCRRTPGACRRRIFVVTPGIPKDQHPKSRTAVNSARFAEAAREI